MAAKKHGPSAKAVKKVVAKKTATPKLDLFRLNDAKKYDPQVVAWFTDIGAPHRRLVEPWFARMRICGDDVREVLHDGCPTACVGDVAFGYVNAFKAHAAVGFFQGASLPDPKRLLEGTGRRMRHVKLRPGTEPDLVAMIALIDAAYRDIKRRISQTSLVPPPLAGGGKGEG